jgi:hypothetical protein
MTCNLEITYIRAKNYKCSSNSLKVIPRFDPVSIYYTYSLRWARTSGLSTLLGPYSENVGNSEMKIFLGKIYAMKALFQVFILHLPQI